MEIISFTIAVLGFEIGYFIGYISSCYFVNTCKSNISYTDNDITDINERVLKLESNVYHIENKMDGMG